MSARPEGPGKGTRTVARRSLASLVGKGSMVSPAFRVDGRDGDYDHVFEWEPEETPLWTSAEGDYSIAGLPDFEPATVVLLHEGEAVGFYSGGELWIDGPHRGKGLSPELVLACADYVGGLPFDPESGIGFTAAGMAAHRRAREIAVARCSRGYEPEAPRPEGRSALTPG